MPDEPESRPVDELSASIDAFDKALMHLLARGPNASEADLWPVFLARDAVGRALAGGKLVTPEACQRLTELDQHLRLQAGAVNLISKGTTLQCWRQSVQPGATAWWWYLDQAVADVPWISIPLGLVAVGLLTISTSVMGDVGGRLLSGRVDQLGFTFTAVQALLAILAGGSLTKFGANLISRTGVPLRLAPLVSLAIALLVFLSVLSLRASLPAIARWWYFADGYNLQRSGALNRAMDDYQKAISLDPNFHAAYYLLGSAYQATADPDKAVAEFQLARRVRPEDGLEFSKTRQIMEWRQSLTRTGTTQQQMPQTASDFLFRPDGTESDHIFDVIVKLTFLLLERGEFVGTLTPIEEQLAELGCFSIKPEEYEKPGDYRNTAVACYLLFVSRGWANLGLNNLNGAENDLNRAIELLQGTASGQYGDQEPAREGAGPYCLLAQVVEARAGVKTATAESRPLWARCSISQRISDEGFSWRWLELAHDRTVQ